MQFHIVGLDLSLTGTGVAVVRPGSGDPHRVRVIGSAPVKNAKYPDTLDRLRGLAGRIVRAAREGRQEGDITVVAIEGPAYGAGAGERGHHVRAGLWWLVYHLLAKEAIVVHIAPSSLKQYVTGKGNAPKDLVFASVVRLYPDVVVVDNNEADAIGLAAMVARELGSPIEPSVQRVGKVAALDGVDWPIEITQRRNA